MGDLTENFSREEFACKCGCGMNTVDYQLLDILQRYVRSYYETTVIINSGCRCPTHNKAEGGEDDSFHLLSKAGDITVIGVLAATVYKHLDNHFSNSLGLILYENFIHVDSRSRKYRSIRA